MFFVDFSDVQRLAAEYSSHITAPYKLSFYYHYYYYIVLGIFFQCDLQRTRVDDAVRWLLTQQCIMDAYIP